MIVRAILFFACVLAASPVLGQTAITTGQGSSQGQAVVQTLPPIGSCFICDCNSQAFACETSCANITEPVARQQCLASCGYQKSQCFSNAQILQRQLDDQRAAAMLTGSTAVTSSSSTSSSQ